MKFNKKILLIISVILVMILIDQLIKLCVYKNMYNSSITVINGFLNFTYIQNTGGAFGIGNSNILIFIITNTIIIGILVIFIINKKDYLNNMLLFAISLIIAGGIGNLIDRIFRGYVIDYIDLTPLIKYPVFNFADICVVVGVVIILINLIINKDKL